jgi:HSF-type DNA-binding
LREVDSAGRSDVISFVDKNAFRVHKPELFFREIVPRYFRHSRLSSFKRQLNLYGFVLVNKGIAQGGYCHELFRKDEPALCRKIRRVAIKQRTATASPPPSISDETSVMDDEDDFHHHGDSVDSFKDLDDGADLNDGSIGSNERTDFLLSLPDHDHESLHDQSALEGLYFEP